MMTGCLLYIEICIHAEVVLWLFICHCVYLIECENAKCWLFAQNGTMPSVLHDAREIYISYHKHFSLLALLSGTG